MEVYIPGTWPVHVIAGCLANLVGIPDYTNMRVLIVQPHNNISISSLADSAPSGNRRWADVSKEKSRLYDMQWYLTNGDLLLLHDASEPLRELTDKEKTSHYRCREAETNSYYGTAVTPSYLWPDEDSSTAGPKIKAANRSVGIHIRKHVAGDTSTKAGGGGTPDSSDKGDLNADGDCDTGSSPTGPSDIEGCDRDKSRSMCDISSMLS